MNDLESLKMKVFFNYCRRKLQLRSEIGGSRVEGSTLNFHHLFEKSSSPEIAYSIRNIMVVDPDEHANLNFDPDYYEETMSKREWIKEHWDELAEESVLMESKIENLILNGILS